MLFSPDRLIFTPQDVDLRHSPLKLSEETFVLGAFNPGLTRLPNGNLLLMVRVAEALRTPVRDGKVRSIRWTPQGYALDGYDAAGADLSDPRVFALSDARGSIGLTSLSWMLPVELSEDGQTILTIHYDKVIAPSCSYQNCGVEDPRITFIDGVYYLTACAVSAERLGTCLYTSRDGLNYTLQGLILDHQNKDMLFFEGKIGGRFCALARPVGSVYFAYPPGSPYVPGPAIHLAFSPDALHWRPQGEPLIRIRKDSGANEKLGGGAQPILTPHGWLVLYHGVASGPGAGSYRTFWAMLDAADPARVLHLEDTNPLLEARADLTAPLEAQMYLHNIVFTTGIAAARDHYIVASGEGDLACRITHVPKGVVSI